MSLTSLILNWKRPTDCNFKSGWLIDQAQKLDSVPCEEGLQIHSEAEQSSFGYSERWMSTSSLANWILTRRQEFLNCAWQISQTESGKFHQPVHLSTRLPLSRPYGPFLPSIRSHRCLKPDRSSFYTCLLFIFSPRIPLWLFHKMKCMHHLNDGAREHRGVKHSTQILKSFSAAAAVDIYYQTPLLVW